MTKKGLSDIVTAILFILLILIAIGIIWAFIRPAVEETSQVQSASSCLLVRLDATRCVYSGNADNAYASVMLVRGADNVNLSNIQIAFASQEGSTIRKGWNQRAIGSAVPKPYESSGAGFSLGALSPTVVAIAGMVGETLCAPSDSIICTPYAYEIGTGCYDFNRDGFGDRQDYDDFVGCYQMETDGNTQGEPCSYDYDPSLRRMRVDASRDGGVTPEDFNAFTTAFIIGDTGGC